MSRTTLGAAGTATAPTFIGVGEHKCGTTWLAECLRRHPQVFMSSPKEIHFFGGELESRGIDWYLDHFRRATDHRAVGEFSTSYLSRGGVAAESILRILGPVRILVAIRHPIARLVSHVKHEVRNGRSFGITDGILTEDTIEFIAANHPKMLDRCRYHRNIRQYIEVFGRERILILVQEDFRERPGAVLSELYAFIGVDDDFRPDVAGERVSVGIIPRFQRLEEWRRTIYLAIKRIDPRLVYLVKRTGAAERYRTLNASHTELRPDPGAMERLADMFADDMDRIRNLLGRTDLWRSGPEKARG